jgi:DNA-binding NarL/FixJ family response regulator
VLQTLTAPSGRGAAQGFSELTDREQQVVELVAQGLGNQLIAARLGLSPKTVMNYLSNVFAKLQVADRAEMIVRAREAGLGGEEPPS